MPLHVPVIAQEVLTQLDPQPGQVLVDCTVGVGGHSRLLAERVGPAGRVIALDLDATMIAIAKGELAGLPITFVHAGFDQLPDVLRSLQIAKVDGILADLGFCSDQVNDAQRGFSFQSDGPLDMRLDATRGPTAAELLASISERELADVIWKYGEERHSRRIARRIVQSRQKEKLATTAQLVDLIHDCVPRGRTKIDPATRTFQALRIAVNDELGSLESLMKSLPYCLRSGGRAAVISFHSLEDRIVKWSFRESNTWRRLTKKPIVAQEDEQRTNPRSRSAKLRAAERIT